MDPRRPTPHETRASGHLIQEVRGFDEFGPEGVEGDVGGFQVPVEAFGKGAVLKTDKRIRYMRA
jgi:hypothetical protein